DLLLDKETLDKVWIMRKMISRLMGPPPSGAGLDITGALEALLDRLAKTKSNREFLATLSRGVL
ncbi:MAG: transcription termination factor Rho, partial [Anaerolineae bacterium]|nr:transcription termination factor Rho [Anaerolineae bacterium]